MNNQNDIAFMAGQRFMLGFTGTRLNQEAKTAIDTHRAGGIILFRQNIESPEQLSELCFRLQEYAAKSGLPKLFIAIDQEGGQVARLSPPFTVFPGNPHIHTKQDAKNFARITATELFRSGINMNMCPVMDVVPKGEESIMAQRAFPGDARNVAQLGVEVITELQKHQVMAVAKHFPGIGRTVKDSHFHLPLVDVSRKELEKEDMVPFVHAIKAGVSGIMLSHIMYPRLDPVWQASLSPAIVDDILRRDMGYGGLILTDDLDMKAISHDMETCIRQIVASGTDLILICHSGPNIAIAVNELRRLIEKDERSRQKTVQSLERIMAAKEKFLGTCP